VHPDDAIVGEADGGRRYLGKDQQSESKWTKVFELLSLRGKEAADLKSE
jgi:hypothetical protein